MIKMLNNWQKRFYGAMIVTVLGIVFSTIMTDAPQSLGTVFVAIGGLLFISGINLKNKSEQEKEQ